MCNYTTLKCTPTSTPIGRGGIGRNAIAVVHWARVPTKRITIEWLVVRRTGWHVVPPLSIKLPLREKGKLSLRVSSTTIHVAIIRPLITYLILTSRLRYVARTRRSRLSHLPSRYLKAREDRFTSSFFSRFVIVNRKGRGASSHLGILPNMRYRRYHLIFILLSNFTRRVILRFPGLPRRQRIFVLRLHRRTMVRFVMRVTVIRTFQPATHVSSQDVGHRRVFRSRRYDTVCTNRRFHVRALRQPLIFVLRCRFTILRRSTFRSKVIVVLITCTRVNVRLLLQVTMERKIHRLLVHFRRQISTSCLCHIRHLLRVDRQTRQQCNEASIRPMTRRSHLLRVVTRPRNKHRNVMDVIFLALLRPNAYRTCTTHVTRILCLTLRLRRDKYLQLIRLQDNKVKAFVLVLHPRLVITNATTRLRLLRILFVGNFTSSKTFITIRWYLSIYRQYILILMLLMFPIILNVSRHSHCVRLSTLLVKRNVLRMGIRHQEMTKYIIISMQVSKLHTTRYPRLIRFVLMKNVTRIIARSNVRCVFIHFH